MNVLMVGVDESTKGGMWTVVENYLSDDRFVSQNNLVYVPTSISGNFVKKICFTLKAYIKIVCIFMTKKIDITHVHMSERGSVYRKSIVMKIAKMFDSKVLLHMHGAELEVWYKSLVQSKQEDVKRIINSADKVVILGEYWLDFISSIVDVNEKIQVVYNAVTVPDTYLYSRESKRLLFLGAITKRKGILDFLEALKKLPQDVIDGCSVDIYGPCVEINIENRIKKMKLDNWVHYCGWLGRANKEQVLKNTMVNVLPSYNEGLPMTILETMAYGIPSITTNVAAIPEVVNDYNGYVIEPGDIEALTEAIRTALENKGERMQKSKQAYMTIKDRFSVNAHINQIRDLYEEMVSK